MKKILGLLIGLLVLVSVNYAGATTESSKPSIIAKTAKKIVIQWDKVENADKYRVKVIRKKNRRVIRKKVTNKNKITIRGLKAYKKYKVKIKAKVNGEYQDDWSVKTVRTDKGVLYLVGEDNSTTVEWESELNAKNGYKLVWSKNKNPEYPTRNGDMYQYYSNSETDEGEIYAFDGSGEYYVRVCEYVNGGCDNYSNQIKVLLSSDSNDEQDTEDYEDSNVGSIVLSAYEEDCNNSVADKYQTTNSSSCYNVQWETQGESSSGFKLVWSKNTNPEYPSRSGDNYAYYSSPEQEKGKVAASDGSGTYYVRVCEYLGGACGVYSNQISLEL